MSQASKVALRPRRRPRQARSQVTVTAILDATVRVLLQRGYGACTTRLVAEVAGVGIGSVYEYFPNKEALIAAVIEREADRCLSALERELAATFDRPFQEALRAAVGATLRELEARREIMQLLIVEYPHIGKLDALGQLPMRAAELTAHCFGRWIRGGVDEQATTFRVLANMLMGAYLSQTLLPAGRVSQEEMRDALVDILVRVLEPRLNASATCGNSGRLVAEAGP